MASDVTGDATGHRHDRLLLAGWIAAIAIALPGTVHDTDPYWQVRAGQENLDGLPLARPDSWSWAPVDGLFYPNSPGWNVLLAAAWRELGSWGMYLLAVASIAACLTLTAWLARRLGARAVPTLTVLLVSVAASLPLFSPRPALPAHVLYLLAVALAAWWAERAGRHGVAVNAAAPLLAGLALSMIGNWVHLSWSTLAVATAAAWAVLWLLSPGLTVRTRAVLIAGGTVGLLGGVLAGPYGLHVIEQSRVVVAACRGLVLEWLSPFSDGAGLQFAVPAVGVVVVAAAGLFWCLRAVRRRPRDRRLPLAAALLVAAVPYAAAGTVYLRFVLTAVLMLAPVAAMGFTALVDRLHARAVSRAATGGYLRRRLPEWTSDGFWRVIAWATLVVVAPLALFAGSRHAEPATQAVNDLLPTGCREFGTTSESASIILTRPDVPVWIDGRADYWGHARNALTTNFLYHLNQPTLVPPGTTCIVLTDPRTDRGLAPLTAALDADPAWRRVPGTSGANLWLPAAIAYGSTP